MRTHRTVSAKESGSTIRVPASGPFSRFRVVWNEIRDRKVLRVSIAYLLVGWLVMQVGELLVEALQLPPWSFTLIVILMALGFPMAVALAWAYEITPDGIRRDEVRGLRENERHPSTITAAPPPQVERDSDQEFRLMVLAPRDLTENQELEWFCKGLAEEVQLGLSRLPRVALIRREPVQTTGEMAPEPDRNAAVLDLDALLESSVRCAGGKRRICFQLVSARTRFEIWNRCFNCDPGDELELQQSLAKEVCEAIKLSIRERLVQEHGINCDPAALEYLQRGRDFFRWRCAKRTGYAVQMFEKAVDIDPLFGIAWAYLAVAHGYASQTYDANPDTLEKARDAVQRAMQLAPQEPMSWVARGVLLSGEARHEEADEAFRKANALDPGCFEGWYFSARNSARHGDLEQACEHFRKAADCDPDDYQSMLLQGQLYVSLDRPEQVRRVLEEGVARAERSLERHPDDYRALNLGALGLLQIGQEEKARAWMQQSLHNAPRDPVIEYNAACFYSLAKDTQSALRSLNRCKSMGALEDDWWQHDSHLDALRDLPEFRAIVGSDSELTESL